MLTDIFANRYANVTLWESFEEKDRRFLVQAFRIISEQLYSYWTFDGKESPGAKEKWITIHDKLSMELGLEELSKKTFFYSGGHVGFYTLDTVCKNFVCTRYDDSISADRFMKERMSFVEIAFRERSNELIAATAELEKQLRSRKKKEWLDAVGKLRLPGNPAAGMRALIQQTNQEFRNAADELNARIRQAGCDLHYHNGFIQRSTSRLVEEQIEAPFWSLVSDPIWKNVDADIKQAIDVRDSGGPDPASYAAKALESTIKIISEQKKWSHGGERGAHNYIDNLAKKKTGPFLEEWEKEALKDFFTHVRNPLSHGPGSQKLPVLGQQQTEWAIEFCMIWAKSLIRRLQ